MLPKEKAIELIVRMYNVVGNFNIAKQCAIIAVKEILNQDPKVFDHTESMYHFEYWSNVLNEIEALSKFE